MTRSYLQTLLALANFIRFIYSYYIEKMTFSDVERDLCVLYEPLKDEAKREAASCGVSLS